MSAKDLNVDSGASRVKRSRLSRDARGKQLLDIAERLFVTNGYEVTTLEDIVREAGVTRPVIYEHYGSKEGVFLACAHRARTQFEDALMADLEDLTDRAPLEVLTRAGDVFFSMLEKDPKRWSLLFGFTMAETGPLADGLTNLRLGTIEKIAEALKRIPADVSPESALACAHALSGVGEQLGRWWQRNPGITRERVLEYYSNFILGGLERVLRIEQESVVGDGSAYLTQMQK